MSSDASNKLAESLAGLQRQDLNARIGSGWICIDLDCRFSKRHFCIAGWVSLFRHHPRLWFSHLEIHSLWLNSRELRASQEGCKMMQSNPNTADKTSNRTIAPYQFLQLIYHSSGVDIVTLRSRQLWELQTFWWGGTDRGEWHHQKHLGEVRLAMLWQIH